MADPQKTKVALRALYQMIGDTLEEDAQGPSSAATGSAPQRLLAVTPWRELGTPAAAGSFTFTPRLSAPQRELGTPAARSFTPRLSAPQRELGTPAAVQTPLATPGYSGQFAPTFFNMLKKGGQPRGRKRFSAPAGAVVKPKDVYISFFALPGPTTFTPKSSEETMILQQAGLGKSTVPIPVDACHSRIEAELEIRYPKLATLSAGWMFKKSTGGVGQRKLHAIPMETGGYTGQQLKDETNGGKIVLYIVPVQEQLDTTPLPPDDEHFAKMPKKTCKICGVSMPLPLLASHVDICEMSSQDNNPNGDPEIPTYDYPESPRSENPGGATCSETTRLFRCPICQVEFSEDYIESHASYCGESALAIDEPYTRVFQDDEQAATSGVSDNMAPEQGNVAAQCTVSVQAVVRGQTFDCHRTLLQRVRELGGLQVEEATRGQNVVVVFCPISSRHMMDIEAAMKDVPGGSASILVLMHHTQDVEYPNIVRSLSGDHSWDFVNVLYHETGLLTCTLNKQAVAQLHGALMKHSSIVSPAAADSVYDGGSTGKTREWMATPDPKRAAFLFTQDLLLKADGNQPPLKLCIDIRKDVEEQDRAILCFYKKAGVHWASPLDCQLKGDSAVGDGVKRYVLSTISDKLINGFHINMGNMAVTRLFEGEPGHLLPNTDDSLVESDFFLMAGRMVGHVFLHGGPGLPGLSPAMIHVLGGGAMDTATIVLEDCPDLGFREVLQLLQGDGPIQELDRERIVDLCGSFSVPPVIGNRKWLFERLLHHAVLVLPTRQWKQLRKGLKETGVWPLVQQRPEVVALLFPDSSEICTAQMLLDRIVWPQSGDLQCSCRVASYLREFIDTASSQELTNLLKFWTGWAIPPRELKLEYFSRSLPEASTCFEILRLPDHYTDLMSFKTDIKTCLNSVDYGFGLE